jgi:hypothetical protein
MPIINYAIFTFEIFYFIFVKDFARRTLALWNLLYRFKK